MSAENQSVLLNAINGINARLDRMNDALEGAVKKTVELDAWKSSQAEASKRFLDQTWPTQTRLLDGVEERVRNLERDRVTQERLKELERSNLEGLSKIELSLKSQIDGLSKMLKEQDDKIQNERKDEKEKLAQTIKGLEDTIKSLQESDFKNKIYWGLISGGLGSIITVGGEWLVMYIRGK